MSRFTRLFLILIVPTLLVSGVAMAAAEIPAAQTPGRNPIVESLYPVADTYVYEGGPSLNYGSVTELTVGTDGSEYLAYVRFDLSSIPANAIVVASDLSLYSSPVLGDSVSVSIERADEVWDETTLTWDSRPVSTDFGIPPLLLNPNSLGYKTWDVTEIVQGWYNTGEPNHGFLVRGAGSNILQFESREMNHAPPRLNVWFEYPTPAPSDTPSPAPTDTPAPPTDTPEPTPTAGVCPGTIEIPAFKDTYLDFNLPDRSFGSAGLTMVGHASGRKETLAAFSLEDLGPGDFVLDARLEMSRLYSFGTGLLEAYLGPILEPWDENTATANTAPAWDTNGIPEYIQHFDFTHTWDVTEIVRGWNQGTIPNHGLRISAYSDPLILAAYATREIGVPARLVIECGSSPPPPTATPTFTPTPTNTSPPSTPSIDYVAEAAEITQGIQNLYNHVELVEGKPTFVRFYARAFQNGNPVVGDGYFNASVSATRDGESLGKIYNTIRRPWQLDTAWSRADSRDAFVFMLPPHWTRGVLELTIQIEPLFGEAPGDEANNAIVMNIGFRDVPPVCMAYIPVRTLDLGSPAPDFMFNTQAGIAVTDRAESQLPTDRLWPFYRTEPLEKWDSWNSEYTGYDPAEDTGLILWTLWWTDQFSDDPDECDNIANTETIYTGVFVPFSNPGTLGAARIGLDQMFFLPTGTNTLDAFDVNSFPVNDPSGGVTLAHELAHTFWAYHNRCNGEEGPIDDDYPYPQCQFGETNPNDRPREYFAFDSITRSVFPSYFALPAANGPGVGDLMSYASVIWPSAYTWNNLVLDIDDSLQAPKDLPARLKAESPAAGSEILVLAGDLNPINNQIALSRMRVLETGTLPSDSEQELLYGSIDPDSPYTIQLLDAQGQLLLEQPFETYHSESYPSPSGSTTAPTDLELFFGLAVPFPSETAEVRITAQGKSIESVRPSANPPQVSLLAPSGGSVGDTVEVTWTGSDPDGDRVLFMVQYSPDNGASWLTLAVERGDHRLTVDTTNLPGTTSGGLIRVIADDGFHTAMDQSDTPFSLARHAPQIALHQAEGAVFNELEPVTLEATVLDAEDTFLDGEALQWSHELLGDLGTGSYLMLTDLPTGEYTLVLTATDSDGMASSAEITIVIEPAAPEVCSLTGPAAPVQTGNAAVISGGFYAVDLDDNFTASVDWGDGSDGPVSLDVENGVGTITGGHSYAQAGVYTPVLTVTDQDGVSCQAAFEWIVVFEKLKGMVTGGGWFDSPAGAYLPDPDAAGKANFGLVAKYKRNSSTPDGNLHFQAPGLNFHSTQIDWLLVLDDGTAAFGGTGTIDGEGEYHFAVQLQDGSPDSFEIRIWVETAQGDVVIYDSAPGQPLGGGNIIVRD